MKEQKHTPGPWGFSGPWGWLTKEGGFSIVAGKQNEQVVICSRNSCGPDAGEMIANARLIAAAPDMLEALMNYCAECNGGDDERCPYYNKDGDMCRMAQDGTCDTWMTICKATGHDPATPWGGGEMTLKEAYRILRRYEDFRTNFDQRCVCDAFPSRDYREAVRLILASRGLGKPIINCTQCVHHGFVDACKLHVKGECKKFEGVKP